MKQRVLAGVVAAALAGVCLEANSGGFAIGTQSGSGTGNAFAGGAAAAQDASTVWYNPAGMGLLPGKTSYAVSAHALKPSFKFQNSASTLPIGTGEGGDSGLWAAVPQAYFATVLSDRLRLGLAFNVPFGLATEYDQGWRGDSVARLSDLRIFNFNAALAYQVSDAVSVGAGLSLQRALLKFNSVPDPARGLAEVQLDDYGAGFNFGVLFQPSTNTRIGMHYRSSVSYQLEGTLRGAVLGNVTAQGGVRTPESFSISAYSALTPHWDLMGDITWTGWSRLKHLDVIRTSGPLSGQPLRLLSFDWTDTWRYSVGANYKVNPAWKVRFGIAYDQSPANDAERTPRVPDQDRIWVAIGGQYRVSKSGVLDFGYAHEFFKDAKVNNASPAGRLVGYFKNKADILSVQYSHAY